MKKVVFRPVNSRVTATVQVEGYEPFDITFAPPGPAALLNFGQAVEVQRTGTAALDTLKGCLKSWTLPEPYSPAALERLADPLVMIEIANVVMAAGAREGN